MPGPANASMRTPLGRVRGHGTGHGGTAHFIAQRVSAVALLILGPWLVVNVALSMPNASHKAAIHFLEQPVNAVAVILFLLAGPYHMRLGMQVIVEDYIHKSLTKALLLVANTLLAVALAAGAIFSVLFVSFGAV